MAHQNPQHLQNTSVPNLPAWVKGQPQHMAALPVANSLAQTLQPLVLLVLRVQTQSSMVQLMLTLQVRQEKLMLQAVPTWWRESQKHLRAIARPEPGPQSPAVLLAPSVQQPQVDEPEFRADTRGSLDVQNKPRACGCKERRGPCNQGSDTCSAAKLLEHLCRMLHGWMVGLIQPQRRVAMQQARTCLALLRPFQRPQVPLTCPQQQQHPTWVCFACPTQLAIPI